MRQLMIQTTLEGITEQCLWTRGVIVWENCSEWQSREEDGFFFLLSFPFASFMELENGMKHDLTEVKLFFLREQKTTGLHPKHHR